MEKGQEMLDEIRRQLGGRNNIRWIIGGSCSGKTTLCRALAEDGNVSLYDMDEHIFGGYVERYTKEEYPANSAWFSADDPLDWALSLTPEEFDRFNRAANLEYMRLFAEDMAARQDDRAVLVDGGISYPAMLAKVIPPKDIVCLNVSPEESERTWETAESKKSMKTMIFRLPDPEQKWKRFLECNKQIIDVIQKEARECGIVIVDRDSDSADRLKEFFICEDRR